MSDNLSQITNNILASRKYHVIYRPTVERIVKESIHIYGEKYAEGKARNVLHQIWGAYYPIRPDFKKLETKILQYLRTDIQEKTVIKNLLMLHASTKERFIILETFYKEIFSITGTPTSIIDHACGLNPLTISWMKLTPKTDYKAYDIDCEEINFLDRLKIPLHLFPTMTIQPGDIMTDTFPYADVVFLFKLIPVLEQQKKDSILEILTKQKCKFLIVSFPIKSLGGKEKGMTNFYEEHLLSKIEEKSWNYKKLLFPTELVFIIQK